MDEAAVLAILVEANTTLAQANLAKLNAEMDATKATATATTSSTSRMSSALSKVGRAAKVGAAAGVVAFGVAAKKSFDTTEELAKSTILLNRNLGLSTKKASEWAGVARARGVDTTKLGMAFKTLASQVSAAGHGSSSSIAMFKELGFSQKDIAKSMKDTNFATMQVAKGFENLPAGVDKATFAGKLFGRGWQTIFPMLRDGTATLKDQLNMVNQYGGAFTGKNQKAWEDFLANQREMKIAWQGVEVQLGNKLLPVMKDVEDQFKRVAAILGSDKLTNDQKVRKLTRLVRKDFEILIKFFTDHLASIAENAAHLGLELAKGIVTGFLHADVWGKLAIATFLITKMGGWGAIASLGGKIGTTIGTKASTTVAAEGVGWKAAGSRIGAMLGPAIGAASIPIILAIYQRQITDWFHSHGFTLPGETVPGNAQSPLNNPSTITGAAQGFGSALGLGGGSSAPAGQMSKSSVKTYFQNLGTTFKKAIAQYGNLGQATQHWSDLTRGSWDTAVQRLHDDGQLTDKQFRILSGVIDGTTGKSSKSVKKMADILGINLGKIDSKSDSTQKNWSKNQGKVQKDAATTNQKVSGQAAKMADNVGRSYGNMAGAVSQGLGTIGDQTNAALKQLGLNKTVNFRTSSQHAPTTSSGQRIGIGKQRGGMMVGGVGSGDKVPAMLEPGEFVMNREAVRGIGRSRLEAMNKAMPRFAKGGSVQNGLDFALGPYTVPPITYDPDHAGANSHVHVSAFSVPWLIGIGHKLQQMGNSVGEFAPTSQGNPFNFGPITTQAHAHYPTDHYSGHAIDVNSTSGPEDKGWVSSIAHVLSGGAAAVAVQKIARMILKGPGGPLRDIGQGVLDKTRNAANAFLAKQSPMGMGIDPGGPLKGGRTVAASWFDSGDGSIRGGSGMPYGNTGFAELGWSGGSETAATGLGGLPYGAKVQVGFKGHSAIGTKVDVGSGGAGIGGFPRAIDIGSGLARSVGLPVPFGLELVQVAKAMRGGSVPWFGSGTDFIARHPQLIGVGDRGAERVQVTPAGGGDGGGGGDIHVHNHHYVDGNLAGLIDMIDSRVEVIADDDASYSAHLSRSGM